MVSAPSPHHRPEYPGLLAKLLARVRPEFRVEVYLADPDDPVLGRRPCAVPGCDRSRSESGLCTGHAGRWRARGRRRCRRGGRRRRLRAVPHAMMHALLGALDIMPAGRGRSHIRLWRRRRSEFAVSTAAFISSNVNVSSRRWTGLPPPAQTTSKLTRDGSGVPPLTALKKSW